MEQVESTTNEQTEDTYQIQNQESFKRRGVQVKVSMDSASESPTTQNTSEVPKEKEIKEEKASTGFKSTFAFSIGGCKPESNDGLVFSTNNTKSEKDEPKMNQNSSIISITPKIKQKITRKSKYFDNIDPDEMGKLLSEYQSENPAYFIQIMVIGSKLSKFAEENDVPGFHSLFIECPNKNLLFWHVSKAFKIALECFNKDMVEYMLKSLEIDLSHEVFKHILSFFIEKCIDLINKPEEQRYAAEILELLLKGRRGLVSVDEIEPKHPFFTALHITCFYGLYELAKKLIQEKADLNPVDANSKTPLGLLKLRMMKAHLDGKLELKDNLCELIEIMESKGAVVDWRTMSGK